MYVSCRDAIASKKLQMVWVTLTLVSSRFTSGHLEQELDKS